MKGSLSAAGGTLLVAAVLFGTAGAASADVWDWNRHYPDHCSLGTNDDSIYHHVTKHGVYAGIRDADACRNDDHGRWDGDRWRENDGWGRGWDGDRWDGDRWGRDRWGGDDFGGRGDFGGQGDR